jgi:hypothetical protein
MVFTDCFSVRAGGYHGMQVLHFLPSQREQGSERAEEPQPSRG